MANVVTRRKWGSSYSLTGTPLTCGARVSHAHGFELSACLQVALYAGEQRQPLLYVGALETCVTNKNPVGGGKSKAQPADIILTKEALLRTLHQLDGY